MNVSVRGTYGRASLGVVAQTLGQRIREARERAKLSQAALGDAVGVRAPTVFRWEKDTMAPERETLRRLATVLGTSVEWLDYGISTRVESDEIPESFRIWREEMAPANLDPEVEAEMLRHAFRFDKEDAEAWDGVYRASRTIVRRRQVSSVARAADEETARVREEAEKAGLMKPSRRRGK